jgi:hypothetical protein
MPDGVPMTHMGMTIVCYNGLMKLSLTYQAVLKYTNAFQEVIVHSQGPVADVVKQEDHILSLLLLIV